MPSSSLLLSVGTVLSTLSPAVFATKYSALETYTGANWLDAFKFETYDLNNGFVNYVDEATAKRTGLYSVDPSGDVKFGVDATEKLDYTKGPGRKSVRLEGKTDYNKGLFVLDVKAMPGVCGMWPSFWSLGREPWPVKGEIDIIEGVNNGDKNKYVLHTDTKCKVDGTGMTAAPASRDCALDGSNGSSGCDVNEVRAGSFGDTFKGGYYVMEWDSNVIQMWFFARDATVPRSLNTASPDTSEFGPPAAKFAGSGCDIEQRFKDQRFIFTNNFCGDWAGNVYSQSSCPKQFAADGKTELNSMDSCKKYVAEHPEAFKDQFWKIGSFKTYTKSSVESSSSSSASVSRTSSIASSSSSSRVISSSTHSSSSASTTHVSSSASSSVVSSSASVVSSVSSHVSSSVASSSSAHVTTSSSGPASSSSASSSVQSSSSLVVHSSSSSHVVSSTTPVVSSTSPVVSSTSHVLSSSISASENSSIPYPTGSTSSVVYPTSSPCSSSSSSVYHYGNFSSSVTYSVPPYQTTSSAPVYGGSTKSTPCTTSSAKGASSTPASSPPAYVNSASKPVDYPSYPVSSPINNDYPYLPSFTPLSPYPAMTSQPSYNTYASPSAKPTITTTYTSTYIDVCETGYTTKTTTLTVTYTPTPTPSTPANPPQYGWDTTTKLCHSGCADGPKTVTLTLPCTQCDLSKPSPTPKDVTVTTKIYATKVITLTMTPVPKSSASVSSGKPAPPVYGGAMGNGTVSGRVGTGVKGTPSKTGYSPPVFTGAAGGVRVGGVVGVVGVVAAMFL